MPLNKTKGNMYEWITDTWNPLAGACPHGCTYCSTNKLMRYPAIQSKYSGEPRLQESEMKTNLGAGNFIFVCAQNDLFAKEVPLKAIQSILKKCHESDSSNRYFFQTRNTERCYNFREWLIGMNATVCTTIESNRNYPEICPYSPAPLYREMYLRSLNDYGIPVHVTIEPIMDFDMESFVFVIKHFGCVQVHIGADSGKNNLPEPQKEKVLELIERLSEFTKVNQKSNLQRLLI